jgi:hydroxyacylglutathione hydrolase
MIQKHIYRCLNNKCYSEIKEEKIDVEKFKAHQQNYTIVDVRNISEVKEKKVFENSLSIPLGELMNSVDKIATNKPVVVYCEGGYRSAAASSLLQSKLNGKVKVYDLGEAIKDFE